MTETWYEQMIEEPVRELVRLLRGNGYNTTCSCGHTMEVECSFTTDNETKQLDDLLFHAGHENYTLVWEIQRIKGFGYNNLYIKINKDKEVLNESNGNSVV